MNSNKQPTIYDIAEYLGISTGTVNRALNNKGRISEQTRARVLEAAEKLGYKANKAAQSLRRNPIYIGALLCCPIPQYLEEVKNGMVAAFTELKQFNVFSDIRIIYYGNSEECGDAIRASLDEFKQKKYAGVALFLSGNNAFLKRDIDELSDTGIKVATVANDVPNSSRIISVSADGVISGSLAAEILSLCCSNGKIAILTGSQSTAIHKSNITGFLEYSNSENIFSHIDIYEHDDIEENAKKCISEMLTSKNRPDGIYITSAISQFTCKYISTLNLTPRPKIVMTDLFEENRKLLRSKAACATIYQNPHKQGQRVIFKLYDYICENHTGQESYLLVPQAVFASNMQLYPHEAE